MRRFKLLAIIFAIFAVLLGFSIIGCQEPSITGNNDDTTTTTDDDGTTQQGDDDNSQQSTDTTPTVTGVFVQPSTPDIVKGQKRTFTATVEGTHNPAQTVTWSIVEDNVHENTVIDQDGELTVSAYEELAEFTVKAVSTVDTSKFGTATVTVYGDTSELPTIDSVTVDPSTVEVERGNTHTFTALVTGTNSPQTTVFWSITNENKNEGTTIGHSNGELKVAHTEALNSLTIRATSTVDDTKWGEATVTVTGDILTGDWVWEAFDDTEPPNNGTSTITMSYTGDNNDRLNFTGNVTSVYQYGFAGWAATPNNPETWDKFYETAVSFSFKVTGDGKTYLVKIPTSDISDWAYYEYAFTAPLGTTTTITRNIPTGNGNSTSLQQPSWTEQPKPFARDKATRIEFQTSDSIRPGSYNITIWDLQLNMPQPAAVTSVIVNPNPTTVTKGKTRSFGATVAGTNSPPQTVTWSIDTAGKNSGTTISTDGVLTVALAETLSSLTVRATSTYDTTKYGTATVTINNEDPPFRDISATELVGEMTVGWNLGNSLDAYNISGLGANPGVGQIEALWQNPATSQANIDALKRAGFNSIRIPITWYKVVNNTTDYVIRPDWMERVKQIVDYAVDNDMYIIINTHHDHYNDDNGGIFKFNNANKTESIRAFNIIWAQIAEEFKDYNEKLIFEGLNEPRNGNGGDQWNGGNNEERGILNEYYQNFVDTVRGTGGNNEKRILLLNTYAAGHTQDAMGGLVLPSDSATGKLAVSYHAYEPFAFAHEESGSSTWNASETNPFTQPMDRAVTLFVNNDVPVIVGEFGAMDKNNEAARAAWAQAYVSAAGTRGIKCFWWDDGKNFRLFNRASNRIIFPQILEGLMAGAGVTNYEYEGPSTDTNKIELGAPTVLADNNSNLSEAEWISGVATAPNDQFQNAKYLCLELTSAPVADFQIIWRSSPSGPWWEDTVLIDEDGVIASGKGYNWNAATGILTIELSLALKDYATYKSSANLSIVVANFGPGYWAALGFKQAYLLMQ
uniref:Glycoside hydrolase family 5 n=1 Tax=uncultured bacterium contig00054 TaxID=1181538 RepID=A0A806KRT9_9BACT|nr:glycoside hydrolase family 5 [uncultured bacterium contig00054]